LPAAVRNTIRAEAGAAEIHDIQTGSMANGPIYIVNFARELPPLWVAKDGSVLNPDLSTAVGSTEDTLSFLAGRGSSDLNLTDLPEPVLQNLKTNAADLKITDIDKEVWGDRTMYRVTFSDPDRHPAVYISADGKTLDKAAY
jgi:hypothetical protein